MDAISKLFLLDRNVQQREAHTAHFLPAYAKVEIRKKVRMCNV